MVEFPTIALTVVIKLDINQAGTLHLNFVNFYAGWAQMNQKYAVW
jgi:hypothetical protein